MSIVLKRKAAENHADATVTALRDPYRDPASREFRFRQARFRLVREMIEAALTERNQVRIIDLGGTEKYWEIGRDFLDAHRDRLHITLVNPEVFPIRDRALFTSLKGDATASDLMMGETFDIAHSNSVIEHVGWMNDMARFADNMRRLGNRYYMQTPNYWFPLEPHFRFPGFQYLPGSIRIAMLQRVKLGFFRPLPSYSEAKDVIDHHRLLSMRQVRRLFPDAQFEYEWVYGLPKSIMAMRHHPVRHSLSAPPILPDDLEETANATRQPA
ncbi:SAM-dependent methyltransferase [Notoacmeibacter sp. MSK16QG-6]|uniref:SAM-dependent methyltransferase n=1 Tax=Notoacmeibacter sp. MSK16QG-6 TaxID=2957982 RepID=UPI00209FB006|nr:SAM-dependent methyltransferase [Notoacmeibacter sp. MSK16QG-6]MCP1199374.1 SAM-dependent methyltransferase [Notoacmeibacter sp. MSK16QG-6]